MLQSKKTKMSNIHQNSFHLLFLGSKFGLVRVRFGVSFRKKSVWGGFESELTSKEIKISGEKEPS